MIRQHATAGVAQLTSKDISDFADHLYGYLYFHLEIQSPFAISRISEHFKEVIGRTVLAFQRKTHEANQRVLENAGFHGISATLILCDYICALNRTDGYFKKLFYVSAFILDTVYMWNEYTNYMLPSAGPMLWKSIFQTRFESEFESNGGWEGLEASAETCFAMIQNENLAEESLFHYFNIIWRAFRALGSTYRKIIDIDDILIELDNLKLEGEEDSSSAEKIRKLQPESEMSVDPSPQIPELAQADDPCEGTSKKYHEGPLQSLGTRNPRKRKLDAPPEIDSDPEEDSTSPCKAKVDKK